MLHTLLTLLALHACLAAVRVPSVRMALPSSTATTPVFHYKAIEVATGDGEELVPAQEISLVDLTPALNDLVRESGVVEGTLHCVSRHTTTALTINEMETVRALHRGMAPLYTASRFVPTCCVSALLLAAATGRHPKMALHYGGAGYPLPHPGLDASARRDGADV